MKVVWRTSVGRSEYYYGDIAGSKVSSQIGRSTNAGKYVWMMFHEDIKYSIAGEEAGTLEEAKLQVQEWVDFWVK